MALPGRELQQSLGSGLILFPAPSDREGSHSPRKSEGDPSRDLLRIAFRASWPVLPGILP